MAKISAFHVIDSIFCSGEAIDLMHTYFFPELSLFFEHYLTLLRASVYVSKSIQCKSSKICTPGDAVDIE